MLLPQGRGTDGQRVQSAGRLFLYPLTCHSRRFFERCSGSKPKRIGCRLPKLVRSSAQRDRYRRFRVERRARVIVLCELFHNLVHVQRPAGSLKNLHHMLNGSGCLCSPQSRHRNRLSLPGGFRVLGAQFFRDRYPLSKGLCAFQNRNQLRLR